MPFAHKKCGSLQKTDKGDYVALFERGDAGGVRKSASRTTSPWLLPLLHNYTA